MMVNISHSDEHSFVNLMPIPPVHSESATLKLNLQIKEFCYLLFCLICG